MVEAPAPPRNWTRLAIVVVVVAVALFGLIQLVPARISHPPVKAEPPWDSARTRQLAVAACFDCHSNQTRGFWYEHVAPISWWIKNHVDEGRSSLNFSEWDPNNHRSGAEVARRIQDGSMPPSNYTWLGRHPDAKLTASQKAELITGLERTMGAAAGRKARDGRRD